MAKSYIRKTKIIATLGPATNTKKMVMDLAEQGVDVFRLNLSHGTWEMQEQKAKLVREVEEELDRPLGILVDTRGPEVRIIVEKTHIIEPDHILIEGKDFTLSNTPQDIKLGQTVVYGDGDLSFVVEKTSPITLKALNAGVVETNKSLTFLGSHMLGTNPPEKDVIDLKKAAAFGVDFVAVSFTNRAEDVENVRHLVPNADIIAKIETGKGVENIEEIMKAADGIMVARGDLGIEINMERVPIVQKELLRLCNERGKTAIVATQMLESMISEPRPTRAEISDVANAVWQGASAVMLSGETAIGKYPLKTVEIMRNTVVEAEKHIKDRVNTLESRSISDAIGRAVDIISLTLKPDHIVCLTRTGFTAKLIAKERPKQVVFACTPTQHTARKLLLSYAIHPITYKAGELPDERIAESTKILRKMGLVKHGDLVLFTYGVGSKITNAVRIVRIKKEKNEE